MSRIRKERAFDYLRAASVVIEAILVTGKDEDGQPVIDNWEWTAEQENWRGLQSVIEDVLKKYDFLDPVVAKEKIQ